MFVCYHCLRFTLASDTRVIVVQLRRDELALAKAVPVNVCSECYALDESERQELGKPSLLTMHGL